MDKASNTQVICGTVLLIAVLGGVFALAWHGTFTGAEVFGIVMSVISIGGAAFAVHSGVKAGSNATTAGALTTTSTTTDG
jgi:mannose/fructose/N-acetylgalactosamine-specific phosphotransferase system component IID